MEDHVAPPTKIEWDYRTKGLWPEWPEQNAALPVRAQSQQEAATQPGYYPGM